MPQENRLYKLDQSQEDRWTKMPLKKSPGGSIFPYPYKDGELFGLHLGSFGANEEALISRMDAEEVFFAEQNRSIALWIDFYETRLTNRVIDRLIEFLVHSAGRIPKLGLVGCSAMDRRKINRRLKKTPLLSTLAVRYFSDPEEAKTWLVSELG
jgi:hypothetical protein